MDPEIDYGEKVDRDEGPEEILALQRERDDIKNTYQ